MKPVLVTGAGGYGASYLCYTLSKNAIRVNACDARPPPAGSPAAALLAGCERVFACDVTDAAAVRAAVRGCRAVFHLAALVPFNLGVAHSREALLRVNVEGTRNVVEACRAEGVHALVLASSTGVVFRGADVAGGDERSEAGGAGALGPEPATLNDAYSESKALAERLVLAASSPRADALACVAIRPNGIWGPGEQHHTPKLLLTARLGCAPLMAVAPHALTDFTHRANLAHAFALALARLEDPATRPRVAGRAYFVTDGWPCHTLEFFSALLAQLGFAAPFPAAIVPRAIAVAATRAAGLHAAADALESSGGARVPADVFRRITLAAASGAGPPRQPKALVGALAAAKAGRQRRPSGAAAAPSPRSRNITSGDGTVEVEVEVVVTSEPLLPLPGAMLVPVAFLAQLASTLLRPVFNFEPFLTLADVRKVVRHNYYSSARAKAELGYAPVVSPAQGLREAVAFYRASGVRGEVAFAGSAAWVVAPLGIALTGALAFDSQGALRAAAAALGSALPAAAALHVSAGALARVLRAIFYAALASHVGQAAFVFAVAWPRSMAAGLWALQSLAVGFASTELLCRDAGLRATSAEVRASCIGFFVLVVAAQLLL